MIVCPEIFTPPTSTGFTQFADNAAAGGNKYYVSSSGGNNVNDGLSPATPKKNLSNGVALLRNGFPDWLLLKAGDVWTDEFFGNITTSGVSSTYPIRIATYGVGARPKINSGNAAGSDSVIFTSGGTAAGDYVAITGLEFHCYTRDPSDPGFIGAQVGVINFFGIRWLNPLNWLLIEDCKLSFYANAIDIELGPQFQLTFRRNIVVDSYIDTTTHSQGLFSHGVTTALFEENFFDHNGWNETVASCGATTFNHNIYINTDSGGGNVPSHSHTFVGNIFSKDSSGNQFRSGGTVDNNLFISSPYGHNIGVAYATDTTQIVKNNVHIGIQDNTVNTSPTVSAIYSINTTPSGFNNVVPITITNNLLANKLAGQTNGGGISIDSSCVGAIVSSNVIYNWPAGISDAGTGTILSGNIDDHTDSTNTHGFPDPSRTVASYAGTVGLSTTTQAFLDACRARQLGSWNTVLTAAAVNSYMRSGFGMVKI